MGRDVAQEPIQALEGAERSGCLFARQRTGCWQNPGIDGPPVVQQVPDSNLELLALGGRGFGFRVDCRSLGEGGSKAGGGINGRGGARFYTLGSQPCEESVDVPRV